jgi:phosphoglycolate phosphatase-like HAD superfamily hydrolase
MKDISVVVTDLDNTLYDWFEMWYCSFNRMLTSLVEASGIRQEILEKEIRQVFQRHGTPEYEFLFEELPSLKKNHPNEDLTKLYSASIQAYRDARAETYHLYPTVMETLTILKERGCLIAGYTESRSCYTLLRVKKLQLDGLLDYLYSPLDHHIPSDQRRNYNLEKYKTKKTIQRCTRENEYKPNPQLLLEIIKGIGAKPEETIYVGDSLMKDIQMAQQSKVIDVFAAYGISQDRDAYNLLRRVSHWKEADVEREKQIYKVGNVEPNYILKENFGEVLDLFNFVSKRTEATANGR